MKKHKKKPKPVMALMMGGRSGMLSIVEVEEEEQEKKKQCYRFAA